MRLLANVSLRVLIMSVATLLLPCLSRAATDWTGRVIDVAGRPIPDAEVYLLGSEVFKTKAVQHGKRKTDHNGKFEFPAPKKSELPPAYRLEKAIVVLHPDFNVGGYTIDRTSEGPNDELLVTLKKRSTTTIQISDSDGKPKSGADVSISILALDAVYTSKDEAYLKQVRQRSNQPEILTKAGRIIGRNAIIVPEPLTESLRAKTDREGEITFDGIDEESVGGVTLHGEVVTSISANFYQAARAEAWPNKITLPATAKLRGSIKAEDAEGKKLLANCKVNVQTSQYGNMGVMGSASRELFADADGKFEVEMPVGYVSVVPRVETETGYALVTADVGTSQLKTGKTITVDAKLAKIVNVRGKVVDQDHQPVAGFPIIVPSSNSFKRIETGDDGTFSLKQTPGYAFYVLGEKDGFEPSSATEMRQQPPNVPEGVTDFEMPNVFVARLKEIAGTLLDDNGEPVAGAKVTATWSATNPFTGGQTAKTKGATTNDQGRFQIADVNTSAKVRLRSRIGDQLATRNWRRPHEDEKFTLKLIDGSKLKLHGQLLEANGKPAAGLKLNLVSQTKTYDPNNGPNAQPNTPPVKQLMSEVVTDQEGRFEVKSLDPELEYRITAGDPSVESFESAWFEIPATVPDITVHRRSSYDVVVRTKSGKPLAGVVVEVVSSTTRGEVETDDEGKCRVENVSSGGFLFARHAGMRFHGQTLPAAGEIHITMAPAAVENPKKLKPVPNPMPLDKRRELALKIGGPVIKNAKDAQNKARALSELAYVDPAWAIEQAEENNLEGMNLYMVIDRAMDANVLMGDFDAALEVREIAADAEDMFQMMLDRRVLISMPDDQPREEKLELLSEMLVSARAMQNPAQRIVTMGLVGEMLLDAGEKEKATKVLRDAEKDAVKLPNAAWAGYAKGAFAEELCQIDPTAALTALRSVD